jgi:hypothetical protein
VQEVRPGEHDLAGAVRAIRHAVAEVHGLQVHAVVLIDAGELVKTSSGKIARHACRTAFPLAPADVLRQRPGVRYAFVAPTGPAAARDRPARNAASGAPGIG